MGTPEDVAAERHFTPPEREDKEALEKIKKIIKDSLGKQWAKGVTEGGTYIYYSEPIAGEILRALEQLGYHKPSGKPPLLSDWKLESLKAEYEGILEVEWHPTVFYLLDAVAQAQRALDIKHYEG